MSALPNAVPATAPGGDRRRLAARAWRCPWPLPALLAWAIGWGAFLATTHWAGASAGVAALAGLLAAALSALVVERPWRRALAAAGFPLSALLAGPASSWPAWVWLAALAPLAALYPLRAWRDAPWFPTPPRALAGLEAIVVPPPDRVLDAGCGLGDGLRALQRVWPDARLHGIEWSRPLAALAARRCRGASVERCDMWARDWSGHDLVYLFQRPESMARAHAKATAELAPGAWLASLEFPVPGREPTACLDGRGRRPVWLYRIGTGEAEAAGAAKVRSIGVAAGR